MKRNTNSIIPDGRSREPQRVVAIGLITQETDAESCDASLSELKRLIDTAGGITVAELVQQRPSPDPRTVLGSGKTEELSELCSKCGADTAVFDLELTPSQIKNIENGLNGVEVIDRSMLILDIFAGRAVTSDGKLQVELAQLKYTAPRLTGKGKDLSRLGGGIGTRGPGETKLETDRRHLQRRIRHLEEELRTVETKRQTIRNSRKRTGIPVAAIVGYTNAGKSTLMNALTDAGILAEDKLFATLDPTTRRFTLPDGRGILITDTVGFIRGLPHHLIKAFRSTLNEAASADILIVMIDSSSENMAEELETTEKTLSELGTSERRRIYVLNKCDLRRTSDISPSLLSDPDTVMISAKTGEGFGALTEKICEALDSFGVMTVFRIPAERQDVVNRIYEKTAVKDAEYEDGYALITAVADEAALSLFREFRYRPEIPAEAGDDGDGNGEGHE
ncbi:MAG: GTPase HflX [Clostridia bacterium]|nr:GTPase HflX [Clostridia bacterium]